METKERESSIRIVKASIFDVGADVLIHQCNCFNTMGRGVAGEMARRYPEAYNADKLTKKGDPKKLGQFSICTAYDKPIIINLYGQYRYGQSKGYPLIVHTDVDALHTGFESIVHWLTKASMQKCTIAMPYKMGAGLGGGDHAKILAAIDYSFKFAPFTVLLCDH